jgi:hypothetical protein
MVAKDMLHRPRLLLAVLASVALVALPTVSLVPSSDSRDRVATDVEALATMTAAVQPVAAQRPSRTSTPHGVDSGAVVLLLTGALAGVSFISSLKGRTRRRLTDVGDRWRCLLFGAPPVLARS